MCCVLCDMLCACVGACQSSDFVCIVTPWCRGAVVLPCRPGGAPTTWPAKARADLVPCFDASFAACDPGYALTLWRNWTDTITALLRPAAPPSPHGYFVNR